MLRDLWLWEAHARKTVVRARVAARSHSGAEDDILCTEVDSVLERFYDAVSEEVSRRGEEWARLHGLLARGVRSRVPSALAERLHLLALRNAANNLRSIDTFQRAVDSLGDVPVCPLKGIALLGSAYAGDIEARVLADVDLLVPEERSDEAVSRVAAGMGLTETAASAAEKGYAHDRCLQDGHLLVELHSRLGLRHGWASRWDDLGPEPGRLHDRDVFLLSPEMTLVHLVTHFVKHGPFARLGWVEDILRLAPSVDGVAATRAARQIRASASFAAGIRAARLLVGEGLLPEADSTLGAGLQRRVVWHQRVAWRRLRREPLGAAPPGRLRRAFTDVVLADSVADSVRVVGGRLAQVLARRRSVGFT